MKTSRRVIDYTTVFFSFLFFFSLFEVASTTCAWIVSDMDLMERLILQFIIKIISFFGHAPCAWSIGVIIKPRFFHFCFFPSFFFFFLSFGPFPPRNFEIETIVTSREYGLVKTAPTLFFREQWASRNESARVSSRIDPLQVDDYTRYARLDSNDVSRWNNW